MGYPMPPYDPYVPDLPQSSTVQQIARCAPFSGRLLAREKKAACSGACELHEASGDMLAAPPLRIDRRAPAQRAQSL